MASEPDSAQALLDAAYSQLDYAAGDLVRAADTPGDIATKDWVTRGGWLQLASKVGAERVFFVKDDPVIVFVKAEPGQAAVRQLFNRAWCLGRPPLLFVAQPGALSVFDLTQPPAEEDDDLQKSDRQLCVVKRALEVQVELKVYNRAQIESGKLFEERRFGLGNRADHALIRDLACVRTLLRASGLSIPHAHALIGQSIFIRYLEDRRILTEEYFRKVARGNKDWRGILDSAIKHDGAKDERRLYYAAVLSDKAFTHALFSRLAKEFNGDLFPFRRHEQKAFTASRLKLMRKFLLGQIEGSTLFTFAYDFDIIPIELISSMYEEFLRTENGKPNTHASFYTPGALVEFVLSQTLEDKVLKKRPRIVDPACGSAIFLVEAFRRLVRHRVCERGQRLRPDELRKILREQIAGIDVQPEAIRVAAFSLYLALLHYLDPPDIRDHRLPNLIYSANREETDPKQHFDILVAANAFDVDSAVQEEPIRKRFSSNCADVVVGNPPWGFPKKKDTKAWQAATRAMKWCHDREKSVGDKELSQAFIHRTQDLLRDGGRAGLLVSTGVFFKRHKKSRKFREQWLTSSALEAVVNFAAVRGVFFKEGIAPFASVVFHKRSPTRGRHRFRYFSAKRTAFVEDLQTVHLSKPDLHVVRQLDFVADEELWKVYWWGGHRDEALVRALRTEVTLRGVVGPDTPDFPRMGQGFKKAQADSEAEWLEDFSELPTKYFQRYGPTPVSRFVDPPSRVHRRGVRTVYEGTRLLVRRGISQAAGQDGRIVARLETDPFCFRNSIHGVRLGDATDFEGKIILGMVWSSLVRYFLWVTSGSWVWHDEIQMEDIERIPIRLPTDRSLRTRICDAVDRLRSMDTTVDDIYGPSGYQAKSQVDRKIQRLESVLDEAIFDLFELTDAERDVVRDMCDVGLNLFYRHTKSDAVKPVSVPADRESIGHRGDLPQERTAQCGLDGYLDAFLEIWDAELGSDGQFRWRVIRPSDSSPMLAVVLSTEDADDSLPPPTDSDDRAWNDVLNRLAPSSSHPFGSKRIYIDGMTRIVGENDIVIIKRNEQRLWTRTAAREDAEATQLEAIHKQCVFERERAV